MEISEVSTERFSFLAMGLGGSNSPNNPPPPPPPPPVDHHFTTLHLATAFNAQLRKRMRSQRRRRSSLNFSPLRFHHSFHLPHVSPPPPPPPTAPDSSRFRFLFDKELKNSDVGPLRRIVIPKKPAEDYLPKLLVKEGFPISMEDMDGRHVWHFKFRYWPNNSSRMYVLENTGGFVNEHSLGLGDYVAFYIDEQKQNYVIEARKAGDQGGCKAAEALTDYGQNDDVEAGVIQNQADASCYYPQSFPRVDDMETTSFVYDTTFSNELSPFDFVGGSITNYSTIDPWSSFGSIESLSIDDFYSAAK
ncbi:PREDICTED: B3 domain-containing transcription factor FUS3-like [Ipomoea nil]|uniref:B3 domain-containing transcription factor FUS3-like n=1 Tax=Ipomoea nil TaxID=35883 RepID=UPI000901A721|nr:PREDICTED: B3 domain-containing transcription factor FUS3-like [Ipomoea nil]